MRRKSSGEENINEGDEQRNPSLEGFMICICCGEPMEHGSERPPSGGNPNQCVPCAWGLEFPASGSTLRKAEGSAINLPVPSPAEMREHQASGGEQISSDRSALKRTTLARADARKDGHSAGNNLPLGQKPGPLEAPERCEAANSVPSGNPFPNGRWT